MLKTIESFLNKYYSKRAKDSLMDFAAIHIEDLGVEEIHKIMEVVHIIRIHGKVDK